MFMVSGVTSSKVMLLMFLVKMGVTSPSVVWILNTPSPGFWAMAATESTEAAIVAMIFFIVFLLSLLYIQ